MELSLAPAGEAMAHVLATFGQFERRLIGQRTKQALAAKKAAGSGWVDRRLCPSQL
jgi:DNA invertase Pin-like site-specific DNA recombinase